MATTNPPQARGHWSEWAQSRPYTLGVEEEVMLLDARHDWSLAQRIEEVLPVLGPGLRAHATAETHQGAIELATDPQPGVDSAATQIVDLRDALVTDLAPLGLRAASAGTHPHAVWSETEIAGDERHQEVYGSMRELARREPTFALHVHIGVPDPESGIRLHNRLRDHLALLLALSANSPFWQGRDTGLASARIPIFQAFPRVGVPRSFADHGDYVETVDLLLRCEAFPEPTAETRIPARDMLATLLHAVRPHADALGCRDALEDVAAIARENGAARQLRIARERGSLAAVARPSPTTSAAGPDDRSGAQRKASMPVSAPPTTRAWTSAVPS